MMRYSGFTLFRQGLSGHRGWQPAWDKATPKPAYDAVIVGGGGHGLATAYYLAKVHGLRRVAVLEKGWIGGGNTGRNTTVIRSNYFYPESVALYDFALRLYEGLSKELNYNIMLSQRGMLIAAHTPMQMEICTRIANAMQLNGVDGTLMSGAEARERLPLLNQTADARFACLGGVWQGRAGVARHDAVAWGYARAASALGVDIIENCTVTGLDIRGGRIAGVETTLGPIRNDRLGIAAAGATPGLAALAGVRLPIHTYALQAFVSEPVKPMLDTVLLYLGTGTYLSQSDKGELVFGGGLDRVPTHGQRGNLPSQETITSGLLEMFPAFGQLKLLRQWAGVVDVVPDSSPVIGPVGPEGLFINCGWGTGGFKAIPAGGWLLAHLLATGTHHEISRPFDLDRFARGRLIDEAAGSGIAH
ncbi:sarcosine oxidase subunit beta [Sulfitobacter alexandrii]|uniref:Sarcosine oxidase subunit beta n=1 Tax=Sulfitobacter alexandrii TaxID=1917485 RepID=A0A1J0WJS1_9RHOB|nr:sarcosine oxidase subunit beta family protein [Sulfitobacter alexandrii]APE44572.1 sarcosine oxidase subunit beta [Sulfitobacter alexandrii]